MQDVGEKIDENIVVDIGKLVELVQEHLNIWDCQDDAYKDTLKKITSWWEISRVLKPEIDQMSIHYQKSYSKYQFKKCCLSCSLSTLAFSAH